MRKLQRLARKIELNKLSQMTMEGPNKWLIEQVLFNNGLFPNDQSGAMSKEFVNLWTKILEKNDFYGDYEVKFTVPEGTLEAENFKVKSNDRNKEKLEIYLNKKLAPKMTKILQENEGQSVGGEVLTPATDTFEITLISTHV